jgi:hypothetical protein
MSPPRSCLGHPACVANLEIEAAFLIPASHNLIWRVPLSPFVRRALIAPRIGGTKVSKYVPHGERLRAIRRGVRSAIGSREVEIFPTPGSKN